jgi:hypothetical protein
MEVAPYPQGRISAVVSATRDGQDPARTTYDSVTEVTENEWDVAITPTR